jgi:hypothetical protein
LGERELCKLEVVGSIPIGSTSLRSRSEEGTCVDCSFVSSSRSDIRELSATENISFEERAREGMRLFDCFDIVKAGLAGLHNRLI